MKKNRSNYIASLTIRITLFLVLCLNSYGQDKKQEFSVSLGGPFSFPNYGAGQEVVQGNGFSAGLRYSYYLNTGLSVGIGVEYQTYSATAKSGLFTAQYTTTDAENESFQFRYKATNLREEQNLGYINIPIGIQFETDGNSKLYLGAGAKIGFAVNGTYETTMQNLTTSGYYPQYNVELFAPAFAGFASTNDIKTGKQDLKTDVSYSITAETGFKQLIGKNKSIYIGIYLDYGLNNIYNHDSAKNLVQYHPEVPVNFEYNSILDSPSATDVQLLSYGLKLRYAMR
jgi:hypothetical protein